MTDDQDLIIDGLSQALGIAIEPSWRDAIRAHLQVTLDHARRVDAFPLPDESEPAPVYDAFEEKGGA